MRKHRDEKEKTKHNTHPEISIALPVYPKQRGLSPLQNTICLQHHMGTMNFFKLCS